MKGRGIDLRDSNGHSLPHLSVRPSDLVTTNALVLTKPLHFADLELEFVDCWERLGKELKLSRHQVNRTESTGHMFLVCAHNPKVVSSNLTPATN